LMFVLGTPIYPAPEITCWPKFSTPLNELGCKQQSSALSQFGPCMHPTV
jgi:hypothetical protein